MSNWIRVASPSDCPAGQCCEVVAGDRIVALANIEGSYYAIDGFCPHQGGSLGKGELRGCVIVCPRHGLHIDARTGAYAIGAPARHPTFPVKVEGGGIFVDVTPG